MKYKVEELKVIKNQGGLICGMLNVSAVAEMKLRDEEGNGGYYIVLKTDCFQDFYQVEESCLDGMLENDEETSEYLEDHHMSAMAIEKLSPEDVRAYAYKTIAHAINLEDEALKSFIDQVKEQ